jgi:zinc-ribbon family
MLIYGNRAIKTGYQSLFGTKCSHCGTKDSLEMYTFSRYFHIFWIPMFPYKKEATTQCSHCKQILQKKEFDSSLLLQYEEMKLNARKAYWQFIGSGLLVFLIFAVATSIKEDNKNDISYLSAPKVDDIYEVELDDGAYSLYKIKEVTSDSIFVIRNKFQTNKLTALAKGEFLKEDSFLEDEYLSFSKKALLPMKTSGTIVHVKRNTP